MTEEAHEPDPIRALPDDVEHDVVGEMKRLEELERGIDQDASVLLGDDPLATSSFLGTVASPSPMAPRDEPPPLVGSGALGRPQTLEDLYAVHPDIGGGGKHLRVHRMEPQRWGGTTISGYLGDVWRQITMDEFKETYGGGRYKVLVMGPVRGTLEQDGRSATKTIDSMFLSVPGEPRINAHSDTMQSHSSFAVGSAPQIEMERIRADRAREEARDREMAELRARAASQTSPDILRHLEASTTRRAAEIRESYKITIENLQAEIGRLQSKLSAREEEVQALQAKIVAVQTEASTQIAKIQGEARDQVSREETTRIRELRDRMEDERARLKEEHTTRIGAMQDDHRRAIQALVDTHSRERSDYERASQSERDRLRDDVARREQQQVADRQRDIDNTHRLFESRLAETQRSYESRIAELQRTYETQLRMQNENHQRELNSIRATEDSKSTFTEKTARIQIQQLQTEISSLRSDKEALTRENASLRDKTYKSPVEAIEDAQQLMGLVGGGRGDEDAGDWKKMVVGVVRTIAEKLPEAAKSVEQVRQHNRGVQQQHPMLPPPVAPVSPMAHPSMQPPQPGARPVARPPGWTPMSGPPPGWGEAPLPPEPGHGHHAPPPAPRPVPVAAAVGMGAPEPARPVMPPPDPPRAAPGTATPPNVSPPGVAPPGAAPPNAAAPTAAPGVPVPPAPSPGPSVSAPQPPPPPNGEPSVFPPGAPHVTATQIAHFARTLNDAIMSGGIITPEDYAEQFVVQVGDETSRWMVAHIEPAEIANAIEQQGGRRTSIPTREGRKYLAAVWDVIRKKLGS